MLFLWILRDCSCFLILVARSMRKGRVLSESKILEKICKFAQQLSRPGKSLENWVKVLKNCKKWVFFKLQQVLYKGIFFFVLLKSYSISPVRLLRIMKKALFLWVFFKRSTDHLFDNLESGKKIIVLEKVWQKSWILDPKVCANPGHR